MTSSGQQTQQRRSRVDRLVARTRIRPAWRLPLIVFVWAQIVLLGWWAAQYPGLFSRDSVRYVLHVTVGPWTADHSVVYDSLVLASLNLTHSVALLTFLQTSVAAAVLAYCTASVHAFGVRARWAVIPGLVLPCVPSFGGFVSMVWKDVPFALAEMLLVATTLRLLVWRQNRGGEKNARRRLVTALGIELLALTIFRNDGFLIVVVVAAVLVLALTGMRRRILVAAIAALVGFGIATTVIYPAGGIKKAPSNLAYGVFYGDIAVAYAKAPRTFTAADRQLMAEVAPLRNWRKASNCYDSDALFRKGFNFSAAGRLKGSLAALWFRTVGRTPVLVVKTRLCRSSVAWDPLPPPRDQAGLGELPTGANRDLYGFLDVIPHDISRNLVPAPLSTRLSHLAADLRVAGYTHDSVQVLIFRGASWCYVLYLTLLVAALRRRRWNVLAIGAVSLANQLMVLAVNPAQLYRYMAGPIFIGMLLLPLVAVRRADPVRRAPATGILR